MSRQNEVAHAATGRSGGSLLVGLVGTANVDRRMLAYGLPNTKIFRPTFGDGRDDVFPEEAKEFGLGMTTPREAARLFELIARGNVVSRAVSNEMLGILRKQLDAG